MQSTDSLDMDSLNLTDVVVVRDPVDPMPIRHLLEQATPGGVTWDQAERVAEGSASGLRPVRSALQASFIKQHAVLHDVLQQGLRTDGVVTQQIHPHGKPDVFDPGGDLVLVPKGKVCPEEAQVDV